MPYLAALLTSLLLTLPQASAAADRACLIEGTFEFMGQSIYSKDCMQTSDPKEDEATFKASCQALANASAQMGGKPGKVEYFARCPEPSQGACKGLLGTQRDAYYYARSASDLSTLPASCEQAGGVWSSKG
jgi:hypothetical protein